MERVPETVSASVGKRVFTGRRGDPSKAPRCLAKTRSGSLCQRPKQRNPHSGKLSRCKLHGGWSTGPKSQAGKAKIAAAAFRHGRFAQAATLARLEGRRKLENLRKIREGISNDPLHCLSA